MYRKKRTLKIDPVKRPGTAKGNTGGMMPRQPKQSRKTAQTKATDGHRERIHRETLQTDTEDRNRNGKTAKAAILKSHRFLTSVISKKPIQHRFERI